MYMGFCLSPTRRPEHRWKDNIKMDLREIELSDRTGSVWLKICRWRDLVCMVMILLIGNSR
jgi:hypothetical protein